MYRIIYLYLFIITTLMAEQTTIKIVYNSGTPPLKFTDQNKQANGMLIDIWKLLADKNNLKIKFIEAQWKNTIEMVKDGRADIHAGIYYTKERDEFLDYTSKPMYENKNYFFYHKELKGITDKKKLKPYVIGVSNGYANDFMKKFYPDYHVVPHDSAEILDRSFANGDFKAILASMPTLMYYIHANNLNDKDFKYSEATFAYSKKYFGAVKQGNKKLLKLINDGFSNITDKELKDIEDKWTSDLKNNYLKDLSIISKFTQKEEKYLQEHKIIKMCSNPNWKPLEFFNSDIKHPDGIVIDTMRLLEKKLNNKIKFEHVPTKSWEESQKYLKEKKCDILPAAIKTSKREKYAKFTKPYLKYKLAIITKNDKPFVNKIEEILNKSIARKEGSGLIHKLREMDPSVNIIETKDYLEALQKVSKGEAYCTIATLPVASYYINKFSLNNLHIAGYTDIMYNVSIAVRDDKLELLSILGKVLGEVSQQEHKMIYDKWANVKLVEKTDYTIVWEIVIVILLLLLIIIYWNYKLKQAVKVKTKEIQLVNDNLEKNVQERTKALKQQTQKANDAVKSKSEFLANMSHEIRTPLNAITGFIDILKEEDIGRKSMEYIEVIDKSSQSLLQIIEDILDFSKIESGKLNIDKIYFDPFDEFKIIIDLFGGKCSEKNILLNVNIDKSLPASIKTDPLRIKQIISNLLSNAVKFTKPGKNIFLDITYMNDNLKVSVKDEGKGIAEDKLEHIFEAFSQEDNSTTREYGGTGLGLTISSELVKALGGKLKVKSGLEVGTEFYFTLPVEAGEKIKKSDEVLDKDFNFKDKKILIVEDNQANQMFMKVILKKINIEFDIANDGVEAFNLFKTNRYDAILMDENMPNMSGIKATKSILEYEKQNKLIHTPIIALTANALKGDRERFLSAGMDEYLTKPLDKNKLIEVLNRLI